MVGVGQLHHGVGLLTELILEKAEADAAGDEARLAAVLEQGGLGVPVEALPLVAVEGVHILETLRSGEGRVEGHPVLVELRELGVLLGRSGGADEQNRQCEQKAVHSKQLVFNRFLASFTQG